MDNAHLSPNTGQHELYLVLIIPDPYFYQFTTHTLTLQKRKRKNRIIFPKLFQPTFPYDSIKQPKTSWKPDLPHH